MLTTIPLTIVGSMAYINGKQSMQEMARNHLVSTNSLKRFEFTRWINEKKRMLRDIARRPAVRKGSAALVKVKKGSPEFKAAYSHIRDDHLNITLEDEGSFRELFIIREDNGLILLSTEKEHEEKYRENELYFRSGRTGTYVQNPYYSLWADR
jgi:hypothetical protein